MQKIAAKPGQRTIWNRMREDIGWDSKEFAEANQRMRDVDDHVRAIVTAQESGNFAPLTSKSLKDVLKSARTNFSRKDYIKCIGDLSLFHKSMTDVLNILNAFDDDLTKEHRKFLLSPISPDSANYDPEYAQYMHDLRQRMEAIPLAGKKAYYSSDLVKEAGIISGITNFFKRNKEMAAWEKRYPRRARDLKNKTAAILSSSESMLTKISDSLKEMASYRATRKIDDWYNSAKKIINVANPYHTRFVNYYNADIKPLLGSQEFIAAIKSDIKKDTEAVSSGIDLDSTIENKYDPLNIKREIEDQIDEDVEREIAEDEAETSTTVTPKSESGTRMRGIVDPLNTRSNPTETQAAPLSEREKAQQRWEQLTSKTPAEHIISDENLPSVEEAETSHSSQGREYPQSTTVIPSGSAGAVPVSPITHPENPLLNFILNPSATYPKMPHTRPAGQGVIATPKDLKPTGVVTTIPIGQQLTSEQFDAKNRQQARRARQQAQMAPNVSEQPAISAVQVPAQESPVVEISAVEPTTIEPVTPVSADTSSIKPQVKQRRTRADIKSDSQAKDLERLRQLRGGKKLGNHSKFMESLETLSNEHPVILAKYILKYANSIQTSDVDTYNKLIDIVKSIKV